MPLYIVSLGSIATLISNGWHFLTSIEMPGVGGSLAMWGVSLFFVGLSVRLVTYALGTPGGDTPRTKSTNKPKISKERKGDTH